MNNEIGDVIELDPKILSDPTTAPVTWVRAYARMSNVSYRFKTNSILEAGDPIDNSLFISKMRLYSHEVDVPCIKRMLGDAFHVWRSEESDRFLNNLRINLKFEPGLKDQSRQWVNAVTGSESELDIAVIKHFMWQAKRKLFKLPVDHHMMIVLFGASGGGKSVAVHALTKPLLDVTTFRDMRIFNDSFSKRQFTRNYVMFFDEMAKSEEADINLLKNIITAPTIDWRGIGSESLNSGPQNCTFIACTNSPLNDRIVDPTSQRRFWQINCQNKLDWAAINSIDYLELWRSINEDAPTPILPFLDQIKLSQRAQLEKVDHITQWLKENFNPTGFTDASPTTAELYASYSSWCISLGSIASEGAGSFFRLIHEKMVQIGWDLSSRRTYRGTVWPLSINRPDVGNEPTQSQ